MKRNHFFSKLTALVLTSIFTLNQCGKEDFPINLPQLTTLAATEITGMTAKSGGTIVNNGGFPITAKGVVWDTSPQPEISLDTKTIETSDTDSFTSTLTGLTPFTTYYVRAYATTSSGTGYGNQITFNTGANLPSITTMPIKNITATSASSGGMITNNGGSIIISQGLVWSTNPEPTIASTSKTTHGTENANFTSLLTDLHPYTTYYLRAYATNSGGTAYGNELVFTTRTAISTYSRLYDVFTVYLGIDLVTTADGGFLTSKEEIVKLDSLGNVLWKKEIRHNPNETKSQIVKTQDRGYLIVNDIALHKFDEQGNVQWTDIRADEHNARSQDIRSAAEMEDGSYLVTSLDWENGPALQKLDNHGNLIWTKYPTYMEHTTLITNAEDNSSILVALPADSDVMSVAKIDSESNLIWLNEYTHTKIIFDGKIIKCNDGSFILAMKTVGPYQSWSNWIVKLDHLGNLIWEKELKLGNGSMLNDVTQVSDGGFVCVGYYYIHAYQPTLAFMLKLDQHGNEVWSYSFKPEQYYDFLWSFWAVEETNDKGLAVLGFKSFIYNSEAGWGSWLLKTDANGNFNR